MTEAAEQIEEQTTNTGKPDNRDYESEASAQGWVPADEFRGDPAKHKGAQEFVELGEQKIPILLNNIKRLTEKVQEQGKAIEYQATYHEKAMKEQNDRLRGEFETKMEAAVAEGDTDAYKEAKEGRDAVKDPEPVATSKGPAPEVTEFIDANKWYQSDRPMTVFADAESARIMQEFPNLTLAQNLDRVKISVEKEFAHKLGNPRREEAPAVSGGRKPGKSSGKTFNDLPSEAKDACEMFRKQGVWKGDDGKPVSADEAQKRYLSTYEWD